MTDRETPQTPILQIEGLQVRFQTPDGEVHAVRGVDMAVGAGETVAVVGESGSGKSQIMMACMGLLAANGRAEGAVRYRGTELLGLPPRALNRFRGDKISMIFQEPMTSLDPLYRIERNPLPWMDEMLNGVEHANFFENRATEYSKAATIGTWEEAFD